MEAETREEGCYPVKTRIEAGAGERAGRSQQPKAQVTTDFRSPKAYGQDWMSLPSAVGSVAKRLALANRT